MYSSEYDNNFQENNFSYSGICRCPSCGAMLSIEADACEYCLMPNEAKMKLEAEKREQERREQENRMREENERLREQMKHQQQMHDEQMRSQQAQRQSYGSGYDVGVNAGYQRGVDETYSKAGIIGRTQVLEQAKETMEHAKKMKNLSYFGIFGVHKFYDGKWALGFLYLFTYGLFLFGWIIDIAIWKQKYERAVIAYEELQKMYR